MAKGDLTVRVDVQSGDEVGQLATVFNGMGRAVEDRIAQVRANEAKFHAIADYSTDCELWLSPAGRLLWVNPRVLTMTGYSVEECLDMVAGFPLAIVVPHDAPGLRLELDRAFSGASASDVSFRIRRKDGSEFWASADWRPIYDANGAYIGVRLSIHDVSQRKEAEDKLSDTPKELEKAYAIQREYLTLASEERARLNALLGAMHIGILFVDRHDKVIYSNPAFEQIWLLRNSKVRFIGMDAHSLLNNVGDRVQGVPRRLRRRLLVVRVSQAHRGRHPEDRRPVHPRSAERPFEPGVRRGDRRRRPRAEQDLRGRMRGGRSHAHHVAVTGCRVRPRLPSGAAAGVASGVEGGD